MENKEYKEFKPPQSLGEVDYAMGVKLIGITNIEDIKTRNRKMIQLMMGIDRATAESLEDKFLSEFYDAAYIMLSNYSTELKDVIEINGTKYKLKDLSTQNVEEYIDIDTVFKRIKNLVEIGANLVSLMYDIPLELVKEHIDAGYLSVFYCYIVKDKMVLNSEFPNLFGEPGDEPQEKRARGFGEAEFTTSELYGWYDTLFTICDEDIIQIDRWYKKPIREFLVYVSWKIRKTDEQNNKGGHR